MKRSVVSILLFICALPVFASHIRGGELYYEYLGPGSAAGTSSYKLTLKLYIDCFQNSAGQYDATEPFTVFSKANGAQYGEVLTAPIIQETQISYDPSANPCITNPPTDVCYRLRYYSTTVELPNSPSGYTIALQRCCRISNIVNIQSPSNNYGATYSCDIPGTSLLPTAFANSSPVYSGNDAVAICANSAFTFDFSAKDPDNDKLVYTLCEAYGGGGVGRGTNCNNCAAPNPAAPPPYRSLPYISPYNGSSPMGSRVTIDPVTGILSGIAPATVGQYVVTACVNEYRNGVLINTHRKDIHLRVADCNPLRALLNPDYAYCDDFNATFKNEQTNPPGTIFIWNFGDNSKIDTSTDLSGTINHLFAAAGTYNVKLKAILAGQCVDSTSTVARVYPGFFPGFTTQGSCLFSPIRFIDTSKTRYGVVNNWSWSFGDETTAADSAHAQNPTWKYNSVGVKTVEFTVGTDKGCKKTITQQIEVKNRPTLDLGFKDTLICSNSPIQDTLQLHAIGFGNFSWTPVFGAFNANTADPLVFPTSTTTYVVQLNQDGCVSSDSVRVRVVSKVTLNAGPDTTICLTDGLFLNPTGDALKFLWSPAATLNDPGIKNPVARPLAPSTSYQVIASIGKCNATDDIVVRTVPYPGSRVSPDTAICYGDSALLSGTIVGSRFTWAPVNTLLNAATLTPTAFPRVTTRYILSVFDNQGCPKPGRDTVVITVRPKIEAFAGNDTSVVVGQPLQLNASGGEEYLWSPATGLNSNTGSAPVATLGENISYVVKVSSRENCFAFDTIAIKVFKTQPDIFVPNAFTPGKTQNGIFRPLPVGISRLDYFRVYNRWGQLLYSTVEIGVGWDGKFGGKLQAPDTYVWMVQGRDYTGRILSKKGTVVLIR